MPPRKKPNSATSSSSSRSSKKSNPNQSTLPSKYCIQHFFERHSQNTSQPPKTAPPSRTDPPSDAGTESSAGNVESKDSVQNPNTTSPNDQFQITPHDKIIPLVVVDDDDEGMNLNNKDLPEEEPSPEMPKSKCSVKRFKFSPGMLIRQSQDDGVDEVTWKISPVNERLQAVSKNLPEVIKGLADASRHNASSLRQCSMNNKVLDGFVGKFEKLISSQIIKDSERPVLLASKGVGLKRVNPDQDKDLNGNGISIYNNSVVSDQSPFRTPPSLSYCHEKHVNDVACNEVPVQKDLRQHKKALIELLDQVEDVISVEESLDSTGLALKPPAKKPAILSPNMDKKSASYPCFLVLEVTEKRGHSDTQCSKILRLLDEQSGEERIVNLWDEWSYSVISPGDTVHVIGEFDEQGKCEVNHDSNLVIVHPDILVSGTRVAGSFSCPRRSVLDERLKRSELSSAALIGTLLHQIFQAGLIKEIPTRGFLEEYAKVVLKKNIASLYACEVNENDMYRTLIEAIPKIIDWISHFKDSQISDAPVVNFGSDDGLKKITISEVMDIEEMAWAPNYGLKGMIDASLLIKVKSNTDDFCEKIVPLEFKSGKATNGQSTMDHCAQVILYTLLMSERYLKQIDSGLLYYLHTNETQGILVRRSDLIGLLMRRNELANDILKASVSQELPPMLQSPSMCRGCRHLDVCTIYHKVHDGTTESSGFADIFDSHVEHLTKAHCSFLRHWDRLIDLEAKEMEIVKKQIWHSYISESNVSTGCLSSLVLDMSDKLQPCKTSKDNRFTYHFVHQSLNEVDSKTSELDCSLRTGDYVIISSESKHLAVASGILTGISRHHVSVTFSKRLRLPSSNSSLEVRDLSSEVWRIDKDEFSTSFSVMRFNLVQLFLQNAHSSCLRKKIVDLEVPRFDSGCVTSQDPAISYVWSQKNLNDDQRRALLKILTAKDYALILGMPGTGKTSTMVHAVKALLLRDASILLTSYTNSAVDNLLIKLKAQCIDFVRVGRLESVHEEVRGHCISEMDMHSVEDIKLRLEKVKVVAVTCLGITNPLLSKKKFDICIMDEAGQTTFPVSLGPLMLASTFVLVGDHYQLPPLVQSVEARENGMGVSLFCRLSEAHPQSISALQSQYRMCKDIMELSNALIYGDRLRCGSSEIANARLIFSCPKFTSSWLKEVLDPNRSVIFIDTDMLDAFEAKDKKTVNNPSEGFILSEITKELINNGVEGENIGIITPYNSQTNLIRQVVHTTSVEIHTIDKYQGRDKDCILVSFVRSSEKPKNYSSSLLGDWHRINVALTRAKKKLVMVGSCRTLSKVPLLKLLIEKVHEQSGIFRISRKDISLNVELKRCSQYAKV